MAKGKRDTVELPTSVEAEQAVLGGLLLSPDSIVDIGDTVSESDFYVMGHRIIFRAIRDLSDKAVPFDAITLGDWIENNGQSNECGGTPYLVDLVSHTASAANIKAWAEIVREKSLMRQLMDVSGKILSSCLAKDGRTAKDLVSEAESEVFRIAESGARGKKSHVIAKDAVKEAYEQIIKRYDNPGELAGLSYGYKELDDLTSGLQKQDLIILAARPGMGKSSLSQCIAEHVAINQGKAVAIYSMEMSAAQLAKRLISSQGRIDGRKLMDGSLDETDWPRMTDAIKAISGAKILIDDTPGLNPQELAFRARRLKREFDLGLIVVDYLQLMTATGGSKETRATEIGEISRALKGLAKELDIPVIALSQLNRGVESRTDKRPNMSDLRESGSIEQDADIILFIYRDDYYNPNSEDKGLAEVIISKHRQGSTGAIKLKFFGEYTRFDSLAKGNF